MFSILISPDIVLLFSFLPSLLHIPRPCFKPLSHEQKHYVWCRVLKMMSTPICCTHFRLLSQVNPPLVSFYTRSYMSRTEENSIVGSKGSKWDKKEGVCEKNDLEKIKERWVWVGADQEIELSGWTMRCAQTFSAFPFILLYSWAHRRAHVHAHKRKDTLTHRILLLKGINESFLYFV